MNKPQKYMDKIEKPVMSAFELYLAQAAVRLITRDEN